MSAIPSSVALAGGRVEMSQLVSFLGIHQSKTAHPMFAWSGAAAEAIFDAFKALDAALNMPLPPSPSLSSALASPMATTAMLIAKEAIIDIPSFTASCRILGRGDAFPVAIRHEGAAIAADNWVEMFWRRIESGQQSLTAMGLPPCEIDALLTRAFIVAAFDGLQAETLLVDLSSAALLFSGAQSCMVRSPGIAAELSVGSLGVWFLKEAMLSGSSGFIASEISKTSFKILAWSSATLKAMDAAFDLPSSDFSLEMIRRVSSLIAFNDVNEKAWRSAGAIVASGDVSPEFFFQGYDNLRAGVELLLPSASSSNLGLGPLVAANREQLSIAGRAPSPRKLPGRVGGP